jgi:hypothetical protein
MNQKQKFLGRNHPKSKKLDFARFQLFHPKFCGAKSRCGGSGRDPIQVLNTPTVATRSLLHGDASVCRAFTCGCRSTHLESHAPKFDFRGRRGWLAERKHPTDVLRALPGLS